jgi:hypothetical protein
LKVIQKEDSSLTAMSSRALTLKRIDWAKGNSLGPMHSKAQSAEMVVSLLMRNDPTPWPLASWLRGSPLSLMLAGPQTSSDSSTSNRSVKGYDSVSLQGTLTVTKAEGVTSRAEGRKPI